MHYSERLKPVSQQRGAVQCIQIVTDGSAVKEGSQCTHVCQKGVHRTLIQALSPNFGVV